MLKPYEILLHDNQQELFENKIDNLEDPVLVPSHAPSIASLALVHAKCLWARDKS